MNKRPIKTILCMEDDRFIGEMYVRTLEREGYQVDWVVDGNDGLIAARNKKYDLLLIDIMLPERKGTEVLEALRGRVDLIPDSRVIILTNFQQDAESREIAELKADAYLIKADITPRKLIEIIKALE